MSVTARILRERLRASARGYRERSELASPDVLDRRRRGVEADLHLPCEQIGEQGRPAAIIDRLNKEINAGLADPRMKARIADFGYTVFASSPADFRTFIAAYTEKWAKVIKFSGAKIY